jgi:hypothetical protein
VPIDHHGSIPVGAAFDDEDIADKRAVMAVWGAVFTTAEKNNRLIPCGTFLIIHGTFTTPSNKMLIL